MLIRSRAIFSAALWMLAASAGAFAGSHAYVIAPGYNYSTPASITPLNTAAGSWGRAFVIPSSGFIVVEPVSKQIWDVVSGAISVLEPQTGMTLATIPIGSYPVSLIFDPAVKYAYVSCSGSLSQIDVASRTVLQTITYDGTLYGSLAITNDGLRIFMAANGDGRIEVFNTEPLRAVTFIRTAGEIFVVGSTLLVSNGALAYYDVGSLEETNSYPIPAGAYAFGVSPDGTRVYLVGGTPPIGLQPYTITVLDFATGATVASQSYGGDTFGGVILSPDGTEILNLSAEILVIDAMSLAVKQSVLAVTFPASAAYIEPGVALIQNGDTGVMMVLDQSGSLTGTYPIGSIPVAGMVANPDGSAIYTGGAFVGVNSTVEGRLVKNLLVSMTPDAWARGRLYGSGQYYEFSKGMAQGLPTPVQTGYFTYLQFGSGGAPPDGSTYWAPFWVESFDGPIKVQATAVYSTATNTLLARLNPPGSNGFGPVAFSADSATAYLNGYNSIAVYNARTIQPVAVFNYATSFIALCVSPDGTTLYALDGASIYRLDAATGAQTAAVTLPNSASGMALSPDGATLFATASTTVDIVDTSSFQVAEVSVPYSTFSLYGTGIIFLPD